MPLAIAIVALILVAWNVARTPLDRVQPVALAVIALAAVALIVRWLRRRA